MEDQTAINGGDAIDVSAANGVGDDDRDEEISDLESKIRVLEEERSEQADKIKRMTVEIVGFEKGQSAMEDRLEAMKREVEQSEEERRVLKSVAARAAQLETEVARLQHDLVSSMTESEEATGELRQLKSSSEELRQSKTEIESRILGLEDKLLKLDAAKRELEESAKSEIAAKESEIALLKSKIEAISSKLTESEGSEAKVGRLQRELEEMRVKYAEMEKKVREMENGLVEDGGEGKAGGTKFTWPASAMAAASTGTLVVAVALVYLTYTKRR